MDAYSLAIKSQAKTLTKEHLEKTKRPGYICERMLQSIVEGEGKIARIQSEGDIDSKLGFVKPKTESQSDSPKISSKNKSKPFERNPKRDIVNVG